jgi:hypothetical protein
MFLYVFLLVPVNAHAYLDMGTGSMILQLLVAGIAGAAVFLRLFWTRIKNIFSRTPPPHTQPNAKTNTNESDLGVTGPHE